MVTLHHHHHHHHHHHLVPLGPIQSAVTTDTQCYYGNTQNAYTVTDPFVYMCVASGNPDAMEIVSWIQAQIQNRCLFTTEKGAFL